MDESTDAVVADFLESQGLSLAHFGVKGMRWGIRKDPAAAAAKAKAKIAKQDAKFEKLSNNPDLHMRVWTDSVKSLKKSGDLKAINNKPEYQASKWRLRTGTAKRELQHKYQDEIASKLLEHIRGNARAYVNRSGTRQMDIVVAERVDIQRSSKNQWKLVTRDIKHASGTELVIELTLDVYGRIIDMNPVVSSMAQSDDLGVDLAHFGVKGMKWGFRKKDRPVSSDAQAKQDIKDRVKRDRVASVSNNDLQSAIRRMQLEQDFKRLKVNEQNGVTRWLSSTLLEIGKREVQAEIGKRLTAAALKKVATSGAA